MELEEAEVAIEVEAEVGRGSPILCYWCRDFLPKEQASHKVAQCPYQKQAKDSWWKNQLGNIQGGTATPQLEKKEN